MTPAIIQVVLSSSRRAEGASPTRPTNRLPRSTVVEEAAASARCDDEGGSVPPSLWRPRTAGEPHVLPNPTHFSPDRSGRSRIAVPAEGSVRREKSQVVLVSARRYRGSLGRC